MKKQLFLAFGAAALLASCSNESDSPLVENIYDGYLHVHGSINEVKTRATDTEFASGDKIGVSGGAFSNVPYSYNNSAFAADDDQITVGSDNVTFSAYYPWVEDSKISNNEISFNLNEEGNYDFLWAEANASQTNPVAQFSFNHKMSQLSFIIVDETTENDLKDLKGTITVKNVATTGKFNVSTGAVTADEANSSVQLTEVGTVTDADGATGSTLILPSYTQANTTALKVTLAINDKTFSGEITPALAAGTKYSYKLTIADGSLEQNLTISSAEISGWTGGEAEDVAMVEDYSLQVGDFLLADGTTVAPTAKNATEKAQDIIGVVFYKGNPLPTSAADYNQDTNDVLYNDYYKALVETPGFDWDEHGLALGIKDAKETTDRIFTKAYEYNEDSWFTSNKNDYLPIYDTSVPSQIKGYNNTSIIKKVYEQSGNGDTDATGSKALIDLLSSFDSTYNLNDGAGWYLPSAKELLIWGENLDDINNSLKLVNGSTELTSYSSFDNSTQSDNFYWSSDMYNKTYNWAYPLTGDLTTTNNRVSNANNNKKGYIRFAIAF